MVFLNLEVLKRFILPSQIDFRAFRVFLSSWLAISRELPLQSDSTGFLVRYLFALHLGTDRLGGVSLFKHNKNLGHVLPRTLACVWYVQLVLIGNYTNYWGRVFKQKWLHPKQSRFSWQRIFLDLTEHLCAHGHAHLVSYMRTVSGAVPSEVKMASSAVRCSSRWVTVIVSSGRQRAGGTNVCTGIGGVRNASTLRGGKLFRTESLVRGAAGNAVTLRGLSGELCFSHMVLA